MRVPTCRRTERGLTSRAALNTSPGSRSRCRVSAPAYPATAPSTCPAASAPSSVPSGHTSAPRARWTAPGIPIPRATATRARRRTAATRVRDRWALRAIGPRKEAHPADERPVVVLPPPVPAAKIQAVVHPHPTLAVVLHPPVKR